MNDYDSEYHVDDDALDAALDFWGDVETLDYEALREAQVEEAL